MSKDPGKLAQMLAELKLDYLDSLPAKIERLQTLTAARDWQNLSEEYHKIKGTGKTYGFPEVSIICQALENLAKETKNRTPEIFEQAILLLERMHSAYAEGRSVDLQTDEIAKKIIALNKG